MHPSVINALAAMDFRRGVVAVEWDPEVVFNDSGAEPMLELHLRWKDIRAKTSVGPPVYFSVLQAALGEVQADFYNRLLTCSGELQQAKVEADAVLNRRPTKG
ncbi:MAG: hypothetical protein GY871_04105 [Actinomycetales bacterium]|nr:hypothetical protein [Actinomycetales bacterium]